MSLGFGAKIPGAQLRLGSVEMSFEYSKYFGAEPYTGYEVLLYDCMIGDATLFQRADMVEAGWTNPRSRPRRLEGVARAQFPQLRVRLLGTEGVG